jgi:hypothetical protein
MRIKYKAPTQFLYRRFWRVTEWRWEAGGAFYAKNKAGKELYLPAGMVVIVFGQR